MFEQESRHRRCRCHEGETELWEDDTNPESMAPLEDLFDLAAEEGLGPEGSPVSAARLFDLLTNFPTLGERLETSYEVVAFPGEAPSTEPSPGDVLLVRALGEGNLGHAVLLGSAMEDESSLGQANEAFFESFTDDGSSPLRVLGGGGRLPLDRMLLRRRSEDPSRFSDETSSEEFLEQSPACTCTQGRKYAYAYKSISDLTGVKAKIKTRYGKVCCEGKNTKHAYQVAYANISKGSSTLHWAQSGWGRERNEGSSKISKYCYAEMQGKHYKVEYNTSKAPAQNSTHTYECSLDPATGKWTFKLDGSAWKNYTDSKWKAKGDSVQWTGEIYNKQDDMPGTSGNKCRFSSCQYRKSGASYVNAGLTNSDVDSDDSSEWGAKRVSATALDIWDKKPNP